MLKAVNIPGISITEFVSKNDSAVVYRGFDEKRQSPILVKLLKSDLPSPQEVALFKNEFDILSQNRIDGTPLAVALERHGHSFALILSDGGGITLDVQFRGEPLPLDVFVDIAIKASQILSKFHALNLIHCDLKPQNISYNPTTGRVEIIDFGHTLRSSLGKQNRTDWSGNFHYMSPEQTGRMDRSVDHRTDIYSLGVTFYELLTGRLPFEAKDVAGIVHAQMALNAKPPKSLRADLPDIISEIILKMMSKDPDDRYQSATGLLHDLFKCAESLARQGEIPKFELGSSDLSHRFLIPNRLFGRAEEFEKLENLLHETQEGVRHVVLLNGLPGTGKTRLVNELALRLPPGGLFLRGKFELKVQNSPFLTLIQAVQQLVKETFTFPSDQVEQLKQRILNSLGPNAGVLTALIPDLESLIGAHSAPQFAGSRESADRLLDVQLRFLEALPTPEAPLILFFDDWQWADASSRALIEKFIEKKRSSRILLILASRSEPSSANSVLAHFENLQRFENVCVHNMSLNGLSQESICQMIAETLKMPEVDCLPLAQLILERTHGNAFFVRQFFQSLHDRNYLRFQGKWTWDLNAIRQLPATHNVLDFLMPQMDSFSERARHVLFCAAICGSEFQLDDVAFLSGWNREETLQLLQEPIRSSWVMATENATFRFLHDRIQEATLGRWSDSEKLELNLKMARYLAPLHQKVERSAYRIVHHLSEIPPECFTAEETVHWVKVITEAAQRAREAASFETVVDYVSRAEKLIDFKGLLHEDDLTFPLALLKAEALFMRNEWETSREILLLCAAQYESRDKKLQAYLLLANLMNSRMRFKEARAACFRGLELCGFGQPKFLLANVVGKGIFLMLRLWWIPEKKLMELPKARPSIENEFIREAIVMASMTDPKLYLYFTLTYLARMLRSGHSRFSGPLLMTVAASCAAIFCWPRLARKLVKPALHFDQFHPGSFLTGWSDFFYGAMVLPWISSLPEAIQQTEKARDKMISSGFRSWMTGIAPIYLSGFKTVSGENLLNALPDLDALQQSHVRRDDFAFYSIEVCRSFILRMSDTQNDSDSFSTEALDIDGTVSVQGAKVGERWLALFKLMMFVLKDKPEQAMKYVPAAKLYCKRTPPFSFGFSIFHLYHPIALAAIYRNARPLEKIKYYFEMKKSLRQLKKWKKMNPRTYQAHHDLASAAVCQAFGQRSQAHQFLESAISAAAVAGYSQIEAQAHEMLGKSHLRSSNQKLAQFHLAEAVKLYKHWGALAKVRMLKETFSELLASDESEDLAQEATSFAGSSSSSFATASHSTSSLDVVSLMKAAHSLAGEIEMNKLVQILVRTIHENAGAQRSVLILKEEQDFLVVAELDSLKSSRAEIFKLPLRHSRNVPKSITSYVIRSQERLLLADAGKDPLFRQDPLVTQRQIRSVLCLPIILAGQMRGLIYLEHNAASHVFDPNRIEPLNILVAQGAISLENAKLYEQAGAKARMEAELDTARAVQEMLLPPEVARTSNAAIAGSYFSATECGGDLWHYNMIGNQTFLWMGDATGHGAAAALMTSAARSVISVLQNRPDITPAGALQILNRSIYDCSKNRINMSFLCVSINPDGLATYASAAQPPFLHVPWKLLQQLRQPALSTEEKKKAFKASCSFQRSPAAHLLGSDRDHTYTSKELQLETGDFLILYSDGLIELIDPEGELWGERRFVRAVYEAIEKYTDPESIRDFIIEEMKMHRSGEPLADDVTLVVAQYLKKPAPASVN